jgi:hypothetical protein
MIDSSIRSKWPLAIEIIAVAIAFVWLSRYGWLHGGQIAGSDVLAYIDAGLRGLENTFLLNRYSHVFLLRAFTFIASPPLEAMRLYSGFALSVGTVFVYLSARSLSSTSGPLNGLIAAALFLSLRLALDLIMAPTVDASVMLMVLAAAYIYIQSAKRGHSERVLLILFGALFFLALRTKEVTIAAAVLLPGFGMESGGTFRFRRFVQTIKYVAAGMVTGILITITINSLILDSPLFGFRPSDISEYREQWASILGSAARGSETFSTILMVGSGVLFALYVAAGVAEGRIMRRSITLLWAFPLALITILILFSTQMNWFIVTRGFLSGYAVIAVLASQAGRITDFRTVGLAKSGQAGLIAAGLVAVLIMIGFSTKGDLPFLSYFQAAMAPILVSVILLVVILFRRRPEQQLVILLFLLPLSLYPASRNLIDFAAKPAADKPNTRFELLLAFQDHYLNLDELNMFISEEVPPHLFIGENEDEISGLMNIAFDLRTGRDNYEFGGRDPALVENLESGTYTHLLLVSDDWDWLRTSPQDRPTWRAQYTPWPGPSDRFILLTKNSSLSDEE